MHTGRTSMHIALRVLAGSPRTGELELATQCTSVYVALDAEGRPDPVPTWSPTTSVDLAAQQGVDPGLVSLHRRACCRDR